MNQSIRWPTLVGGIVMTAALLPLAPTGGQRADAQVSVRMGSGSYYNPYGQSRYGGDSWGYDRRYGQGYGYPLSSGSVEAYRRGGYAYPGYPSTVYRSAYRYRYSYGYRDAPYVRQLDRSIYYQPSYGAAYVPFGYRPY